MTEAISNAYGSLNPDAFMTLFITQLKNQDPTAPVDTSQMTSQLAQLASLEELGSLNDSFGATLRTEQLGLARDLIGSEVTYTSGTSVDTGKVDEAVITSDTVGVLIDGLFVDLNDVRGITNSVAETSDDSQGA